MNFLLLILGIFLVLLSLIDALWTALWVDGGAGPVTRIITNAIWWLMKRLISTKRNYYLSLAGPIIQTIIVVVWVGLLWLGWVVVFSSDTNSLLNSRMSDKPPADFMGRVYFVAYSMSTMGNGDFYPHGEGWQFVSALCTFSGMFIITMVVSFLLSVIGGVTTKQALASQITGLGNAPEEWVISVWDGKNFSGLDLLLSSISSQVGTLTEQQLAYPVLHSYHGASPKQDSAPAIAIYDDALTLLRFGVQKSYRPSFSQLQSARANVQNYLKTLASASIYAADYPPPLPDLALLRQAGIPVVSDEEFEQSIADLDHRRQLLLGLVEHNSFTWPK